MLGIVGTALTLAVTPWAVRQVLKIPPGIAHGCQVVQGPAHLFYVTSHVYDPKAFARWTEGPVPAGVKGEAAPSPKSNLPPPGRRVTIRS